MCHLLKNVWRFILRFFISLKFKKGRKVIGDDLHPSHPGTSKPDTNIKS